LRVITTAGKRNLLKDNGRPGDSDHLPIFFSMNLLPEAIHEESLARAV